LDNTGKGRRLERSEPVNTIASDNQLFGAPAVDRDTRLWIRGFAAIPFAALTKLSAVN
jgi:hypothetical protein